MRQGWMVLAAAWMLGACRGGGELTDETMRRSAQQALDTTTTRPAPTDSGYRVPAFVDGPVSAAPPADSVGMPAPAPEWTNGVTERSSPSSPGVTTLREVRAGRNRDFDRVVVDFGEDPVPSFRVEYAVLPVRQCGSGEPVALEGTAALLVRLHSSQAHDESGEVTVRPDIRAGMPVLRQVSMACDFEGEVVLALGVAAAKPYHVLVERSPNRLIVDVKQ